MNRAIVTIVLATYNGERYLSEQLASLSAQRRVPDRVILRDDGSNDRSVKLVQRWADQSGIDLQQIVGSRLGPALSFLTALQVAHPADVYMFCDQDDVWSEDKIERALNMVPWGEDSVPTLCATRLQVVDENLRPLKLSPLPSKLSFSSAAYENVLTGCTMAFNGPFRNLLIRALPTHATMHDWWCYLLATSVKGAVLHLDPTPTVLYRQHGANAVGIGPSGVQAVISRWQRFIGERSTTRSKQLQEFFEIYADDLTSDASDILRQLLAAKKDFRSRVRATFSLPIHRQTFFSSLTTRIALLTNRF